MNKSFLAAKGLTAGLLMAFSLPPWGWWPLALVGIALWSWLLSEKSALERLLVSAAVGFAWFFTSFIWMWDFSPLGYIGAVLAYTLFYGLGGILVPPNRLRWLGLPVILVLVGFLRWNWPFGGVPLSTLAMSLADSPANFIVRFLGPLGLVLAAGLFGVLLEIVCRGGGNFLNTRSFGFFEARALIVGLVFLILMVTPHFYQPRSEVVGQISVALVQGGGKQRIRSADADTEQVFQVHLQATEQVRQPVDLVIWPENVVDVNGQFAGSSKFEELSNLAVSLEAHLLVGIVEDVKKPDTTEGSTTDKFANFVVLLDPTGKIVDRYDKVKLVPFGEYIPLRSLVEPFAPDFISQSEALPGSGPAVLESPFGTLGTPISWEIFFENRARSAVNAGAKIIINPTNGSSYWLNIVQSQQVASSRLRAMAADRWVLQAAPTGFSAIINPNGDVVERTGTGEMAVIQTSVELREGRTYASQFGPWPVLSATLAGLVLLLGFYFRQRFPNF